MQKIKPFIIPVIIIGIGIVVGFLIRKNNAGFTISNPETNNVEANETGNGNTNTNEPEENDINILTLRKITSDYEFFTVNNILNEYYKYAVDNDAQALLSVFSQHYINSHNISKDNIKNYFEFGSVTTSFYSKKMYLKGINQTYYYFIEGELFNHNLNTEDTQIIKEIKFLVIYDLDNNTYSVTPLDNISNIYTYASSYKLEEVSIKKNKYNDIVEYDIDDYKKSVLYISYYQETLINDTPRAYEMLSEKMKEKYPTYDVFYQNVIDIYNIISDKILSYGSIGEAGTKKYHIYNYHDQLIIFSENGIMDFTITIE